MRRNGGKQTESEQHLHQTCVWMGNSQCVAVSIAGRVRRNTYPDGPVTQDCDRFTI